MKLETRMEMEPALRYEMWCAWGVLPVVLNSSPVFTFLMGLGRSMGRRRQQLLLEGMMIKVVLTGLVLSGDSAGWRSRHPHRLPVRTLGNHPVTLGPLVPLPWILLSFCLAYLSETENYLFFKTASRCCLPMESSTILRPALGFSCCLPYLPHSEHTSHSPSILEG